MQLPLTKSSLLRVGTLCVAGLALSAVTAPPSAQAQSRRARTSAKAKAPASSKAAKIRTLEARLRKAVATQNNLEQVVYSQAIFMLQGTIERSDTRNLVVYGKTYGQNEASRHSLGQNNDDNFLTIHNFDPACIINGRYEGYCVVLSQTDFAPVPAQYRQAETALSKAQDIVVSLQNEIEFEQQSGARAARAREKVKLAQAKQDKTRQEKAQASEREGVYRTRVALADRETAAKLAQLDDFVTTTSDKAGAYLQSSAAATALFNKWGSLGVADRTLLRRAFDNLAQAAASQVERGDWTSAMQTAEKLLTLELFERTPGDAQTGKGRIELGVDERDLRMPSTAVGLTMHREGPEPAAANRLAQAWLSKLPAYLAGPATREEKLRVARLSQLLGANVFALLPQRMQTVALAVDALRGTYGPGSLAVLAEYEMPVEAAKRARVARQVAAFSQPGEPNAPVESPRVTRTFEDAPDTNAPEANEPEPAPQTPTAPKEVEKPAAKPLVPALDFVIRSFKTGRKVRLSDFRGKTVMLYFWDTLWMENQAISPTPVEQLFALSKRYDPKKVVFLLVSENGFFPDETVKQYQKIIDPTPDAGRDHRRGYGPRLYPEVTYGMEMGMTKSASDTPAERVVAEQALAFYTGNKNVSDNAMRVTVINPAGQVVGDLDFEEDRAASMFNNDKQRGQGTYVVYDFDEAALEDLLARAMASQP